MSFIPDKMPDVFYQVFDKHSKLIGWFATKKEAHSFAEEQKLKKYTVIGVCPEYKSFGEQSKLD